jgi:hypothetical protein
VGFSCGRAKTKGWSNGEKKEGKMSGYISRDETIQKIRFEGIYGDGYSDEELENGIVDMIESIPAADVQPVRHGRWVTREVLVNPIDGIWRTLVECSECGGEAFKHEVYGYQRDSFCHLCGADMRETEK